MKEISLNNKLRWIHVNEPTEKDIREIKTKFNIHPIILDELLNPSDRSKVENYDGYLFMVYHLPIYNEEDRTSRRGEIDFIATKETLISVTYEPIEPITQFERDLEKRHKKTIQSTAHMIYYIIQEIHEYSLRQLKHVERKVNFVGDQLFKHQDRALLEEISYIRRDLSDFAIIAVPQRIMLESILTAGETFWKSPAKIYFTDLLGDFMKVTYLLENLKATIESYSETVSQLFEFKTSEILRRFSILGFLTFPLLLYSTIALQPKVEAAIFTGPVDFWIIFGIISLIMIGIAVIFRQKGWL